MTRRRYLVAYDIRQDRRLREMHTTVKQFGYPLQYSVFVCDLDVGEKLDLRAAIGRVMKHTEDSVAIVDLGDAATRGAECFEFMGVQMWRLPRGGPTIL